MYGTPSELSEKLLKEYAVDAKISLIAWTDKEVMSCLSEYDVTPEEAASITADISLLDEVHIYGVSQETVGFMLNNIREAIRDKEQIQVPARMLEKVIKLAGSFIDREDIEGGEGFSERNYHPEVKAFKELRKICGK